MFFNCRIIKLEIDNENLENSHIYEDNIKYLGVYLPKETKDLYIEKDKKS